MGPAFPKKCCDHPYPRAVCVKPKAAHGASGQPSHEEMFTITSPLPSSISSLTHLQVSSHESYGKDTLAPRCVFMNLGPFLYATDKMKHCGFY